MANITEEELERMYSPEAMRARHEAYEDAKAQFQRKLYLMEERHRLALENLTLDNKEAVGEVRAMVNKEIEKLRKEREKTCKAEESAISKVSKLEKELEKERDINHRLRKRNLGLARSIKLMNLYLAKVRVKNDDQAKGSRRYIKLQMCQMYVDGVLMYVPNVIERGGTTHRVVHQYPEYLEQDIIKILGINDEEE